VWRSTTALCLFHSFVKCHFFHHRPSNYTFLYQITDVCHSSWHVCLYTNIVSIVTLCNIQLIILVLDHQRTADVGEKAGTAEHHRHLLSRTRLHRILVYRGIRYSHVIIVTSHYLIISPAWMKHIWSHVSLRAKCCEQVGVSRPVTLDLTSRLRYQWRNWTYFLRRRPAEVIPSRHNERRTKLLLRIIKIWPDHFSNLIILCIFNYQHCQFI